MKTAEEQLREAEGSLLHPFREFCLICLEEADVEMDLFVQMIYHGFQIAAVFSIDIDEAVEGEESELSAPSFSIRHFCL